MTSLDASLFQDVDTSFLLLDDMMLYSPNYINSPGSELKTLADHAGFDGVTLDEQAMKWLKMPHIPRRYDIQLLNRLLNVFIKFVGSQFMSFQDFRVTSETLPEQIIAMSAVGALFLKVRHSSRIARMLFTDAQRMLNKSVRCSSRSAIQFLFSARIHSSHNGRLEVRKNAHCPAALV